MSSNSKSSKWLPWGLCIGLLPLLLPPSAALEWEEPEPMSARCEKFVIEWEVSAPEAGDQEVAEFNGPRGPVGLVELRRRRVDDTWQLEQNVEFPAEDVRVMAVERLGPNSPGLIWRELAKGHGRTLVAEWRSGGDQLEVREWNRNGSLRLTLESFEGIWMPLSLRELVRGGLARPGIYSVFDPLQKRLDRWTLELSMVPAEESGEFWRQAQFTRSDGGLAARYQYAGTELMSFCWQESGLRVRRISAQRYEELKQSFYPKED
jgi:hypothetical protein